MLFVIQFISIRNDTFSTCIFGLFRNEDYQLGDGSTQNRGDGSNEMGNALSTVDLGTDFIPIDVEAGVYHVCTISESKEVKCWGQSIFFCFDQNVLSPRCIPM